MRNTRRVFLSWALATACAAAALSATGDPRKFNIRLSPRIVLARTGELAHFNVQLFGTQALPSHVVVEIWSEDVDGTLTIDSKSLYTPGEHPIEFPFALQYTREYYTMRTAHTRASNDWNEARSPVDTWLRQAFGQAAEWDGEVKGYIQVRSFRMDDFKDGTTKEEVQEWTGAKPDGKIWGKATFTIRLTCVDCNF